MHGSEQQNNPENSSQTYTPKRVGIDVTMPRYQAILQSKFRKKYPTFNEAVRAALDIVLAIEIGEKILLDISPLLKERIESSELRKMCPTLDACVLAMLVKYLDSENTKN